MPTSTKWSTRWLPGAVHLHAKIKARLRQVDETGNIVWKRFDTTPGRLRLGNLLPLNAKAPFDLVNRLLRKKDVQTVIDTVYRYCGQKESVIFCDQIMTLGFREAFRAGISFGKDDMVIPDTKWDLVNETREQVTGFELQYMDGLITQGEKYNKVVDAWTKCNDKVTEAMMATISATHYDANGAEKEPNSVYMMAHSGARGSVIQMKQLGGMRGLMAKPSGEIIETPIISNFKEGLTVLEYFNSTHGARKGLSDTALKTANSGYLTRRLVDVAQDCIVRSHDCGTENAITASAAVNDGEVIVPMGERVLGRVAADDVLVPGSDEVLVSQGELIDERRADLINNSGVATIRIRSPLTCEAEEGVCALCYGRDLARGTLVNIGEAVGIIAAQSIGEPGTQLTMRTFHIGGVAQGGQQSFLEASQEGKIEFRNANILKNVNGEQIVVGRNMQIAIIDDVGPGTGGPQADLWREAARQGRRNGQARHQAVRMGPLHPADHRRKDRRGAVQGPGRGHLGARRHRRSDRHDPEDRRRLAFGAEGRRPQAGDHRDGPGDGRSGPQRSGRADQLFHVGGRDPFRRRRPGTAARATWWRVSRAKVPRRRTSPGVFPAWRNCSKPVVRRITRSSRKRMAMSALARTTRTSAASPWNRSMRR